MKKVFLLLLVLVSVLDIQAQSNLVPNSSFEVYDTCPSMALVTGYDNTIYWAVPWTQPHTPENSTDFFHACDTTTGIAGVPNNAQGYQVPNSGVGYAGFIPTYPVGDYREYLEVELTDSLIAGMQYCVSFYVSFSDLSKRACDGIGAFLSDTFVHYNDPWFGVLNLPAQIKNPTGNIISDTSNWVLISDTIIANGGEKFLTIGNFNDDSTTNFVLNTYGTHNYSYYYIDDVSVMLCDSTSGISEANKNNISIFPNPAHDKLHINLKEGFVQRMHIKFYSIFGDLVKEEFSKTEIDIGDLSKGVYFLELETHLGTFFEKLIKQ